MPEPRAASPAAPPAPAASAAPPFPAFAAVWFCYFAAIGMFNPYAPLWFKDLGFSTLAIGAIASLQAWTRVLAPYGWGWLGDHGGRRVQLVRFASALAVLSAAGLLFVTGYPAVAAFTALLFLANGAVVPLSEAALAQHIQRGGEMDTARYGRVRVWGSVGFIVTVVLAGAALERFGIGLFPWLVTLSFALLWLAALRLPTQRDPHAAGAAGGSVWAVLRQPEVAWFFASIFFTVLAHTALYSFFSLTVDALGYPKWAVGALWAVSVAVEIAFFWWQGRLFGRQTPYRWLQWAALASVLRFALVAAFAAHPWALVLAQLLHVVTFAGHHAACIVLVNRHFAGPLRGRGQALYTVLGYGLPGVLGGVAYGWLSTHHGFAAVFWAASGVSILAVACAHQAGRRAMLPAPGPTAEP